MSNSTPAPTAVKASGTTFVLILLVLLTSAPTEADQPAINIDVHRALGPAKVVEHPNGIALDLTGGFGGTEDHKLAQLKPLADRLAALTIWQSMITDAGFEHLAELTELRELTIGVHAVGVNAFGDEALRHLAGLIKLESLSLSAQRATETGLAHIKDLPLKKLDLNLGGELVRNTRLYWQRQGRDGTPQPVLTEGGLSLLGGMTQLEELNLFDYSFPKDGLRHLASLKNLRHLNLAYTRVDDEALKHLAGLRNLETLDLRGTQVSRQGLARFAKNERLRFIGMSGSQLIVRGEDYLLAISRSSSDATTALA